MIKKIKEELEKGTTSKSVIRKQYINTLTPSNIQEELIQEEFVQEKLFQEELEKKKRKVKIGSDRLKSNIMNHFKV